MPQTSYERQIALNGAECDGYGPRMVESYANALLALEANVVLADFSPGTYTVRLTEVLGDRVIDISTGPIVPASIADVVAALEAAADALESDLDQSLLNIAVVTDASPNLEIRVIHPGENWTISFPSNPDGDMSLSIVQAAGGSNIELGVFVVRGPEPGQCKAPNGSSVDADFVGMTTRGTECLIVDYKTNRPVFEPGNMASVKRLGKNWTDKCETAASEGAPVFVRKTITTPGQILGAPRNDADGGNAVQLSSVVFGSSISAGGELVKVVMNRP